MSDGFHYRQRARKAYAIAKWMREHGITADTAEAMSEREARNMTAAAAGQRPPSDETWAMVVAELRSRERHPQGRG